MRGRFVGPQKRRDLARSADHVRGAFRATVMESPTKLVHDRQV